MTAQGNAGSVGGSVPLPAATATTTGVPGLGQVTLKEWISPNRVEVEMPLGHFSDFQAPPLSFARPPPWAGPSPLRPPAGATSPPVGNRPSAPACVSATHRAEGRCSGAGCSKDRRGACEFCTGDTGRDQSLGPRGQGS